MTQFYVQRNVLAQPQGQAGPTVTDLDKPAYTEVVTDGDRVKNMHTPGTQSRKVENKK